MRSYLASTTIDKMWVCVFVCLKGNFVDEQGNRPELVEILCVHAVGGPPELIMIRVVVG